jgi:hypothetical protein
LSFLGHHLKIATNPWSHHVLAYEIDKSDPEFSESNKYRNYWGYEIDMLVAISDILKFKYTIENPPDGKWGHVENGTWNGLVAHAAQNAVDLAICDIFIVHGRAQMFEGTIPFDKDYQVSDIGRSYINDLRS